MCSQAAIARPHGPSVLGLINPAAPGADDRLNRNHEPFGQRMRHPRLMIVRHTWRLMHLASDAMPAELPYHAKSVPPGLAIDGVANILSSTARNRRPHAVSKC